MTRINLVDPKVLTNRHLMAEYRELPRIFTAVKKLALEGKTPSDIEIAPQYLLGKGHVKFFYNKCDWLLDRYMDLKEELVSRGFNIDLGVYKTIVNSAFHEIEGDWWGSYDPSPEEVYLNMTRLVIRSNIETVSEELGQYIIDNW